MFNKMKNCLFYFPLNLLFVIGKLQGLIVFSYATVPEISYSFSSVLTTYSSVYTVSLVIILQIGLIKMLSWFQYFQLVSKFILIFVVFTESLITAFRVIAVYIMQFYHRKQFRRIVSEAAQIHRSLIELMDGALIFDRNFYRCYFSKVLGVAFQLATICFLISLHKRVTASAFYIDTVTVAIVIHMHFTAITISSVFYAGMMLILVFYQNLNRKVLQIANAVKAVQDISELKVQMKQQLYCRLTDEIDQIVYIHEKISTFSKKFNRLFSSQLLLTIVNAFYMMLVQLFYLYDNVSKLNAHPSLRILYDDIAKDVAFLLCYTIDLYHSVSISSTVTKQAQDTGLIFHTLYEMDTRLKRSIEAVTFQNLIVSPKVTACGLFEINSTLLFAASATIASYLVILIQFDINDLSKFNTTLFVESNSKN